MTLSALLAKIANGVNYHSPHLGACAMASHEPQSNLVAIFLNGARVEIFNDHPSGHHIKASAIEQGVSLQVDWLLIRLTPDGEHPVGDHEHIHLKDGATFRAQPRKVEIFVNERPVQMEGHAATGLQVKEAAISSGVQIQLDFVLSEELEHRHTRVIGDTDIVHLRPGLRFVAVAPDDNS